MLPSIFIYILNVQVNSNDDNGVLMGRWSGGYAGGKSPTAWNGSVAILDEYMQTKKPVKYGQCWVFSGVLTTRKYTYPSEFDNTVKPVCNDHL